LDAEVTDDALQSIEHAAELNGNQSSSLERDKPSEAVESKMATLEAHWRVVEQKFAAEMQTAVQNAGQALAEAEKSVKNSESQGEAEEAKFDKKVRRNYF
jgi:hypothetical protein